MKEKQIQNYYHLEMKWIFQTIKRIRTIIEEVKFELTLEDEATFFYDDLC